MKLTYFYVVLMLGHFLSCSEQETIPIKLDQETETLLISTTEHSNQEATLFELINNYRLSIDLNTLEFDSTSYYYAKEHSNYMINQGNTSHDNFAHRAEQISFTTGASHVSENVAKDYDTINEAFEAWLASEGHRLNLEGDYTHSAISIKENHEGNLYFTQLFFR